MCIVCRLLRRNKEASKDMANIADCEQPQVTEEKPTSDAPAAPVIKDVIYQVLTVHHNGTTLGWESKAKSISDHRFLDFVNWYKKATTEHYYFKSNRNSMPSTTMLRRELITSWSTHFEVRHECE